MLRGLRDLSSPEPGPPAVEVRSPNRWAARAFPAIWFLDLVISKVKKTLPCSAFVTVSASYPIALAEPESHVHS